MAASWDRRSASDLAKLQDRLVREQVQHVVAPFSTYWRQRLADLGRSPSSIDGTAALASVPAVGERDVSPTGDPAGMAGLVLQPSQRGFALHAEGADLRRALRLRLTSKRDYVDAVEQDVRPTTYLWAGLGFRFPVASTRVDLDVIARAGARLWRVLGLGRDDALLSAVPVASTVEHLGLSYAALASAAPAMFPGARFDDLLAAAYLAPPTVLAVPSAGGADVVAQLVEAAAPLDRLHTLLLVGAPTEAERAAARAALPRDDVTVLAVHAPSGARVLWGECRQAGAGGGLHTYPDLEIVQLVDPESADPTAAGGEVVITQLGMRGSALLRWRTGDVTPEPVAATPCPGCRRTVPRLLGVRRGALVLTSDSGRSLDLRSVAGALDGRTDLIDWRVVVGRRPRDGRGQVVVHLLPAGDPGDTAVGAATDIRAVAGLLPTQLVAATTDELAQLDGDRLTQRILLRA